jgi:hypothetical protein
MSCPALYCNLTTTPRTSSTQHCLQLQEAYFSNFHTKNAGWENSRIRATVRELLLCMNLILLSWYTHSYFLYYLHNVISHVNRMRMWFWNYNPWRCAHIFSSVFDVGFVRQDVASCGIDAHSSLMCTVAWIAAGRQWIIWKVNIYI